MPEQVREVPPPSGVSRILYRLPIHIYRMGLGRLMGKRFVLLEHRGRVTGYTRRNVLEVIKWDEISQTIWIVSAWGENADWLQNIRAHPEVRINFSGEKFAARAEPLDRLETHEVLLEYAQVHPRSSKELARLLGYRLDGTPEDFASLTARMTVVTLQIRKAD